MGTIFIELGIVALLVFALWRIWPKESAGNEDQHNENHRPETPENHHEQKPR